MEERERQLNEGPKENQLLGFEPERFILSAEDCHSMRLHGSETSAARKGNGSKKANEETSVAR